MKKTKLGRYLKVKSSLKLIVVILVITFSISTTVFAVNAAMNGILGVISNDQSNQNSSNHSFEQELSAMKENAYTPENKNQKFIGTSNYEEWQKAKENLGLSHEEELDLYNQGYDFFDIAKAEHVSHLCDKTPQDILKIKGKTIYQPKTAADGTSPVEKIEPKTWDQVMAELDVKEQKVTDVLGISSEQIADMKNQGLSDVEVQEVCALAFNYQKPYTEIIKYKKNGKKIEDLNKEYWEKNNEKMKSNQPSNDEMKKTEEQILKRQFNISDEDIALCKKNNITNILEVANAKDLANKHNTSLEKVIKIQKDKNDWQKVKSELEGGKKQ